MRIRLAAITAALGFLAFGAAPAVTSVAWYHNSSPATQVVASGDMFHG